MCKLTELSNIITFQDRQARIKSSLWYCFWCFRNIKIVSKLFNSFESYHRKMNKLTEPNRQIEKASFPLPPFPYLSIYLFILHPPIHLSIYLSCSLSCYCCLFCFSLQSQFVWATDLRIWPMPGPGPGVHLTLSCSAHSPFDTSGLL